MPRFSRPIQFIFKTVFKLAGWGGVLFVIAAILFPCFCTPRSGSHRSCLSNMKQMGTANAMYLYDYDETLPFSYAWMDAEYPYLKNEQDYHCPKLMREKPDGYGYAFNIMLSGKCATEMNAVTTIPLVLDSDMDYRNASGLPRTAWANPPRHTGQGSAGNNVTFADGHAKWLTSLEAVGK